MPKFTPGEKVTKHRIVDANMRVPTRTRYPSYAELERAHGFEGRSCAWAGCTATVLNGHRLPDDWVNLLTWWSAEPDGRRKLRDVSSDVFCKRDAVLCGEHAAALEALLRPFNSMNPPPPRSAVPPRDERGLA